jgi:hypothetical protein
LCRAQPVVELAADANPKRTFKEHEQQARATHQHVDGADDAFDHDQVEHPQPQAQADGPSKPFLGRTHVLGHLPAHHPLTHDHGRGPAWVDEEADSEFDDEGHHKHLRGVEVAQQQGLSKRGEGEHKQNACAGAHRAFVEHRHGVLGQGLSKFKKAAGHGGSV